MIIIKLVTLLVKKSFSFILEIEFHERKNGDSGENVDKWLLQGFHEATQAFQITVF